MGYRKILTNRQKKELFGLPTKQELLVRYYTLSDEDLKLIAQRRRPHNKFGFALQLCAFRYPGRLLELGEVIPTEIINFITQQINLKPTDIENYTVREETRRKHLIEIRESYGFRMFSGDMKQKMRQSHCTGIA